MTRTEISPKLSVPMTHDLKPMTLSRYRQIRRQQRFVVDFDQQRVVAGLGEGQVADFVDEIDPVQRALGVEGPIEQRLRVGGVESHRDPQLVRPGRAVGKGEKPDHERVRDRKLPRLDVGKDAQDGVFSRTGVDVNTVAGKPGEELRFGMHAERSAGAAVRRK